jgi:hypothetical protein
MGGVFSGGGGGGGGSVKAPEPKPEPQPVAGVEKATQAQEEAGAKMRGARRRGRQLLSNARLNPEMGMQETLGGGNNLG